MIRQPTTRPTARPPVEPPFDRLRTLGRRRCAAFTLVELPAVSRRDGLAFTLIELLVVISIISLLVAILVPTLAMAHRQAEDARCRARVAELGAGANAYFTDHQYYPGQWNPDLLNSNTGSQVLALALFTDPMQDVPSQGQYPFPHAKYAPLRADVDLITVNGRANTISDRVGEPLAVLYYPARLGETGLAQYQEQDNNAYAPWPTTGFIWNDYIRDTRFDTGGNTPAAPGKFIIVAAGIDRTYGTSDDIRFPQWKGN